MSDVLVRKPISELKPELEQLGVRILKWRYELPQRPFIEILGMIEPFKLGEDYKRFYRAHPAFAEMPAGAKHHHWWVGGLEDHCKEMIGLGFDLLELYPGDLNGKITRTDIVVGVFLHDFAKVKSYRRLNEADKERLKGKLLDYQEFTYTNNGAFDLIDEETWTLLELSKWGITPTVEQWSAVLFAEGGWSDRNFGPRGITHQGDNVNSRNPLAVLMHIMDMYSSQLLGKSLYVRNNRNFVPGTPDGVSITPEPAPATQPAGESYVK